MKLLLDSLLSYPVLAVVAVRGGVLVWVEM
jgi:hypothetical protein